MSDNAYQTNKVTVMLAVRWTRGGLLQMQPPLLADQRFMISGHAAQWSMFETNLNNLRPDLVIVQTDIAPDPDTLIRALQKISAWSGIAIVVLPLAHKDFQGAFGKVDTVRGIFVAPVNWTEIVQAAYARQSLPEPNSIRQRRCSKTFPVFRREMASAYITGTNGLSVLSHAGGAGCSTIARTWLRTICATQRKNFARLSWACRRRCPHLRLRYLPNLTEYFDRREKPPFRRPFNGGKTWSSVGP
jgi:hypothetical protein